MLLALLIILQAADVITTVIGLRQGAREGNPLAARLFELSPASPAVTMTALKIVFSIPMLLLALYYPGWWPVPALYCAGLAYVVVNNLRVIR